MDDIKERLDRELDPTPPAGFELATTVAAGRGVVRRRRLAAGGAALALAAVVGGGALLLPGAGGDPSEDSSQVAAEPRLASGPVTVEKTDRLGDAEPAGFSGEDSVVLVQQGWAVLDRVEDPVTGVPTAEDAGPIVDSVALELRKGRRVVWALLYREADTGAEGTDGAAGRFVEPDRRSTDFDTWVEIQVDLLPSSVGNGSGAGAGQR